MCVLCITTESKDKFCFKLSALEIDFVLFFASWVTFVSFLSEFVSEMAKLANPRQKIVFWLSNLFLGSLIFIKFDTKLC